MFELEIRLEKSSECPLQMAEQWILFSRGLLYICEFQSYEFENFGVGGGGGCSQTGGGGCLRQ